MKQSDFIRTKVIFPGSGIVRIYSFKTVGTRENYALLARANHNLAMNLAVQGGLSAHFQEKDCFECLSPHKIAA